MPTRPDPTIKHQNARSLLDSRFPFTSNIFRQLSRFIIRRVRLAHFYITIYFYISGSVSMRLLVFAGMHTKISCSIRQLRTNVLQSIKNCLHARNVVRFMCVVRVLYEFCCENGRIRLMHNQQKCIEIRFCDYFHMKLHSTAI